MAKRTYVTGALVCSRNTKFEKGLGIIVSERGPWSIKVHWFQKPGHVDQWEWLQRLKARGKFVNTQTRNQIKILKSD